MPAQPDTKLKLGGIKLSDELCLVTLPSEKEDQPLLATFCRRLADDEINVLLLISTDKGNRLCVAAENKPDVERILENDAEINERAGLTSPVGLISVFPTGSAIPVLARLLRIFGESNIELMGVASSLSSLTFVLPYSELETAARVLVDRVELPPGHAPFDQSIRVRQCRLEKAQ